jgi:AcrR family transcriptional regulator
MAKRATASLDTASRKDRALQWRRDYVLDCAERVFARKGFHAATMQEIATEAEYATGTLYGFFDSKDSLYAAAIQRRVPEIDENFREAVARAETPRDRIENFMEAFFEYFNGHKDLFQIYVNVTGGLHWSIKAEFGEEIFQMHLAFLDLLETIVRDGVGAGQFRGSLDARLAAVGVSGVLMGAATDWVMRSPDEPFTALLRPTQELVRALLSGAGHEST